MTLALSRRKGVLTRVEIHVIIKDSVGQSDFHMILFCTVTFHIIGDVCHLFTDLLILHKKTKKGVPGGSQLVMWLSI